MVRREQAGRSQLAPGGGYTHVAERHCRQIHSGLRQHRRILRFDHHRLQFQLENSACRPRHLPRHYGHNDIPQSRHIHRRKARFRRLRSSRRLQHRDFQQHPHRRRVLRGGGGDQKVRCVPGQSERSQQVEGMEYGHSRRVLVLLHLLGLCGRHVRPIPIDQSIPHATKSTPTRFIFQVSWRVFDSTGPPGQHRVRPLCSSQRRPRPRIRAALQMRNRRQYYPDVHGSTPLLPTVHRAAHPLLRSFRLF